MLIIETILTIFAWRNGWKWYSLLPIGITFCLGFIIGFAITLSGGTTENLEWLGVVDIFAIIALIIMVSKKPKTTKQLLND